MAKKNALEFSVEYVDAEGAHQTFGGTYVNAQPRTTAETVRDFLIAKQPRLAGIAPENVHVTLKEGISPEAKQKLSQALNSNLTIRSSQ